MIHANRKIGIASIWLHLGSKRWREQWHRALSACHVLCGLSCTSVSNTHCHCEIAKAKRDFCKILSVCHAYQLPSRNNEVTLHDYQPFFKLPRYTRLVLTTVRLDNTHQIASNRSKTHRWSQTASHVHVHSSHVDTDKMQTDISGHKSYSGRAAGDKQASMWYVIIRQLPYPFKAPINA